MRSLIKKLLPRSIFLWIKRCHLRYKLKKEVRYYTDLVLHHSNDVVSNKNAYLSSLMVAAHVLEKGITMPERRPGFGAERVRSIIISCNEIIKKFGSDSLELQSALADLKQYRDIHLEAGYTLPDDILKGIDSLINYLTIEDENCFKITKGEFFHETNNFAEFAKSRHSVRWFDNSPLDEEKLMSAIQLAQTAPSACNRQATRVRIIESEKAKKICCELQHGNRGFGDKAAKWLLITSEVGDWPCDQLDIALIDAGIFTMNLLYSLHYYGFVACPLNAHFSHDKQKELHDSLGISLSELPATFILVGNPVNEFMIPKSRRLDTGCIIEKL